MLIYFPKTQIMNSSTFSYFFLSLSVTAIMKIEFRDTILILVKLPGRKTLILH